MVKVKTLKEYIELQTCSKARISKIENILNHAEKIIGKPLTKLTTKDVSKYLKEINESSFSNWTKNDHKKIFKRFLKWYYKDLEMIEGDMVKNAFKGVSKKRAFNHEKINKNTLVKPEELESLIRAAPNLKWKALVSFAYESAFRPCEITTLKFSQLSFDDAMNICRVTIVSPKTKDKREIPVRDCVVHLKRWMGEYQFPDRKASDYVFPAKKRNEPMYAGIISEMFKRLCIKAGIRHIYPYMLRHSRIYEIQKRLPEKIAAKFAGHSIETSEIYNHIADDDVENSMLKEIYPTKELTKKEKEELSNLRKDFEDYKKDMNKKFFNLSKQLLKK